MKKNIKVYHAGTKKDEKETILQTEVELLNVVTRLKTLKSR